MGGHVLTINKLRHYKTKFPRAIIFMGSFLKHELVQREVRVGAMYLDFACITPWDRKAIEIDGKNFHRDIVKEQNRDDYLEKYGWRILHIPAEDLYRKPDKVRDRVIRFFAE
jgi:very-short-patch-repair endonuclease